MSVSSFYPVICTDRIAESRDFYTQQLGFEITFEADWYISLRLAGPRPYELALVRYTHPTVPEKFRQPAGACC